MFEIGGVEMNDRAPIQWSETGAGGLSLARLQRILAGDTGFLVAAIPIDC